MPVLIDGVAWHFAAGASSCPVDRRFCDRTPRTACEKLDPGFSLKSALTFWIDHLACGWAGQTHTQLAAECSSPIIMPQVPLLPVLACPANGIGQMPTVFKDRRGEQDTPPALPLRNAGIIIQKSPPYHSLTAKQQIRISGLDAKYHYTSQESSTPRRASVRF